MLKRLLLVILGLGVVFGGVFGWKYYAAKKAEEFMAAQPEARVTVSAIEAAVEAWQPKLTAVGSFRAVNGVDVAAEVEGKVAAIPFRSGDDVEKDEVLVRIDDSVDQAELRGFIAAKELAAVELERQQRLTERKVGSQAELDAARTRFLQAEADVEAKEAVIAKKRIRAPFAGRLGIREVDLGQYLSPGDTVVTLQSLDPIYVDFSLPQKELARVHVDQPVEVRVDSYPGAVFEGRITAVSTRVVEATRNFAVQATLANPDRRLLPGMFGTVSVLLEQTKDYVTLPQTAVSYNPYGDFVYRIVEDGTDGQGEPVLRVERVPVTPGETRGDQVAIEKGVAPGERVVTAGQLKLREGARVEIDNTVTPSNDPAPTPANE